ncbi:quinol:cytochrome C oxidoreductase [Aeoliella mucimassa]|uniref:Quinol:cytochrome C oxidoreductase n=1 Tax=Aeoliella mucimassa TaxID=2527972 RepID=A0A518AH10_9BACT|nr:quinol:cytochrome C oxidoreductase [Aeoliella mucimassa]QDU53992.1 hypothetical protein Pan181_01720 [Aeoliella mucimassa]
MAHTTSIDTWINDSTERRRANPDLKRIAFGPLLILGALALGGTAFWSSSDSSSVFWHAYLIAVVYCTSISLGGLFFVVVQHLTGARWGVVLRRLGEIISMGIGVCGLFFIAILALIFSGNAELYPWAPPAELAKLAEPKQIWLDPTFFVGRQVFYFVVWFLIARYYYTRSVAQDRASDNEPMAPLRWWSGPAMLVFALTINFASMDWLMTLNPTWFSTIFGVYYFAGCAVSIFALLSVVVWRLQSRDILTHTITEEHRHDLGKLLFGFVFFWGYIAFSQFLLIWYAAIPEEVQWYAVRHIDPTNTGLGWATGLLFLFHLIIPFLGIMSRFVRRQKTLLAGWGIYMLVMHWFDLYYIIAPEPELTSWDIGFKSIVIYAGTMAGVGLLYAASLMYIASGNWLVPVRDPRLADSLAFENH